MRFSTFWVMFSRSRMYVTIAQFLMIGYITFTTTGLPLIYVPILLGSLAFITYVDWIYIYSGELGKTAEKNPYLGELMEKVANIEDLQRTMNWRINNLGRGDR